MTIIVDIGVVFGVSGVVHCGANESSEYLACVPMGLGEDVDGRFDVGCCGFSSNRIERELLFLCLCWYSVDDSVDSYELCSFC